MASKLEGINMTKIILDANMRRYMPDLSQPFELCDETGKPLGRYLPAGEGQTSPLISREEIDRRKQDKGQTYTTAEVLAHLEKL
jgi:hypothetical protein